MLPMRTTPPFRADHVGSLLRPPALLAARDGFAAGKITAAQLRQAEDEAIAAAVAMQAAAALHVGSKLRMDKTIFGEDFAYLRSVVPAGITAKQTIPSPNMVHYRGGPAAIDPEVYPDIEGFWADLAAAYADEVRRLA